MSTPMALAITAGNAILTSINIVNMRLASRHLRYLRKFDTQ
jgi:hypothetical protein